MPDPNAATADSRSPLAGEIIERLIHRIGKDAAAAKPHDWLAAAILVIRDKIIDRWIDSTRQTYATGAKRVYYLSAEFLIGRLMRDAASNMEMLDAIRNGVASANDELRQALDASRARVASTSI